MVHVIVFAGVAGLPAVAVFVQRSCKKVTPALAHRVAVAPPEYRNGRRGKVLMGLGRKSRDLRVLV